MPRHSLEKAVFIFVLLMLGTGFLLFYSDMPSYNWYVREDSLVEWITVLGLLMASMVCLMRFARLWSERNWWFLTVTLLLGLVLFFAAGEEISWGQRIFGIESSDYFRRNNAQGETNLHNLVVNGVKINKLIFTLALGVIMGIYLVVIPLLYHKNTGFRNFINRSGVPVPQLRHIVFFLLVAGISTLLRHEKNPELLECGAALIFFLIIRFPANGQHFKKKTDLSFNPRQDQ